MICDHDSPYPEEMVENNELYPRLRRLKRYHIENYFLDETILSNVFVEMESETSWLRDPAELRDRMIEIVRDNLSYAAALVVAMEIWRLGGNIRIMPKACHNVDEEGLVAKVLDMTDAEKDRIHKLLSPDYIEKRVRAEYKRMTDSVETGNWKYLVPGKPIFNRLMAEANIDASHVKAKYIKIGMKEQTSPFKDIIDIFEYFRSL
jgi:hypothetical protein